MAEGAGSPSSPCQQREVGDEVADFQRLSSNLLDLAAIMSVIATIEQEFQEIDDANDWQPRYLVSVGWGAGGRESLGTRRPLQAEDEKEDRRAPTGTLSYAQNLGERSAHVVNFGRGPRGEARDSEGRKGSGRGVSNYAGSVASLSGWQGWGEKRRQSARKFRKARS